MREPTGTWDSVSDDVCARWKISNFAIRICSESLVNHLGTTGVSVPNAAIVPHAGEEAKWDLLIMESVSSKVLSSFIQKS